MEILTTESKIEDIQMVIKAIINIATAKIKLLEVVLYLGEAEVEEELLMLRDKVKASPTIIIQTTILLTNKLSMFIKVEEHAKTTIATMATSILMNMTRKLTM